MVDGTVNRRLLTDADVESHEKLVNLPWNNIFTTNYDNLLEKCIDISKKAEIETRIDDLKKNVGDRQHILENVEQQLQEKSAERLQKTSFLEELQSMAEQDQEDLEYSVLEKGQLIEEIQILNAEISRLQGQAGYERKFISRYESQIAHLNDLNNEFRTTVTRSSDLAIRKNQNIIKIHGSIYTDNPKVFGFDGDASKNYVIAQEDYDSYPQKHEAFMQLMRISLLQESFCLFGFSGIDPNFLAWIAWVRDVIRKNPSSSPGADKIYMIDIGDKQADQAKALFYKNHQIAFIPLGHPDCLRALEDLSGGSTGDNSPKARINLLLDFLSTDKVPSDYKIAYEVLKQNEYQNLWDSQPFSIDAAEKLKRLIGKAKQITALKKYNRIPPFFGDTDHEQQDALEQFDVVYQELKNDPEQVKALLEVTLIMLQEVYLPHSVLFTGLDHIFPLILDVAQEQNLHYEDFLLIDLRDAIWGNDVPKVETLVEKLSQSDETRIRQELSHQRALNAFYNLEFGQLTDILESWVAIDHWVMLKAGLLSHIALSDAIDLLENCRLKTAQENVYKYHILSYLHSANSFRENGEDDYKVVRAIEKGNIKSFNHTIDRMIRSLKKKPEKILPYGEGKLTITNTIVFSKTSEQRISLQLLSLWIESGHPLRLTHVINQPADKVYKPLQLSALWYPQQALYFALQYNDSNFILRFVQDLIYNEQLKDYVPSIAASFMRASFDQKTPPVFQKNIIIALSEFISVLNPAEWKDFFATVWDNEMKKNFLVSDFRVQRQDLLNKGIALLTDTVLAETIVNGLLDTYLSTQEQQVKDNVIQMLYQFRTNHFLKAQVTSGILTVSMTHFNALLERLKDDVYFLFVLGNIGFLFNDGQDELVKKILQSMEAFNNTNSRLWRVILYFGNGDSGIETKVKSEILQSPSLWDSGIDLSISQHIGHHNFIMLTQLRRYRSGKSLAWTNQEVRLIYERMKPQLNNVDHWIRNYGQNGEFREIIQEMKQFLEAEESVLCGEEDFNAVSEKVNALYNLERRSEQNVEALLGEDKSDINIEIGNISEEIYRKDKLAENEFLIDALVYRLLLRKEPGIAAALSAVSNWFFYLPGKELLKKYQRHLELILVSYKDGRDINMDEPAHQECLIKIAMVLKRWNAGAELTRPFLNLLKDSRFNYIRHNLKAEFLADGVDFS